MQLLSQLPVGILCILFTHCARIAAVCPTLPCEQNAPVYGVAPPPVVSPSVPSALAGADAPVSSTTTATPPAAVRSSSSTSTPVLVSSTIPSTSTPVLVSSTTPSATPTSTPVLVSSTIPSATPTSTPSPSSEAMTLSSTPSAEPAVVGSPQSSTGIYSVTPSVLGPQFSTGESSVTPPAITAPSSNASLPLIQSTTASPVSSKAFNSSATSSVPASITQCGSCRVRANQVQVYYWPTASVKTDCARGASISPFQTGVPYASNASSIQSFAPRAADGPTTNVVDGFTFTFPSLYVSVIGGISVSDSCGLKGSVHTNPPPVAVQAITTASYKSWPSTCRPQGEDAIAVIDTLALSDLACPTWGLSNQFTTSCDGSTYLTATYGEPYLPVILVPTELMSIDPAWGACLTNTDNALLTLPCGIYDPPKALQTAPALVPSGGFGYLFGPADPGGRSDVPGVLAEAPALVPSVTAVNDPPAPTTPIALPAKTGSPSLPKATTDPSGTNGGQSGDPGQGASDPAAGLLKLDPVAPSTKQAEDPSQKSPVQQGASAAAPDPQTADSSHTDPNASANTVKSDPNSPGPDSSDKSSQNASGQKGASAAGAGSQGSNADSPLVVPQAPTTINLGGGASSTPGIGAFINGVIGGGSAPAPAPSSAFTPHAVTALGQTFSVTDPSAVAIAGSTLSVGGPAHTADGVYYSLAASGNLVAGTLPASPAPSSPHVLSVAGSTYTANSASQFIIAGQTLTGGGQITVASTPVSLHPSADVAVVGGSTQVLASPTATPNPAVLTFAGSTYTANAVSQFVVAGQTLTPGGQITVSSSRLSLAPAADVAVIGTSTQPLTTAAPSSNPAVLTFAGSTYTANSASQFIIAGQTLAPGGTITASGTPISVPQGTNIAIIGTSTQLLTTLAPSSHPAILTFAGSTYTANAASQFVIAGQTLTPGGTITASGTPISMPQGTNVAIIGTSTQLLTTPAPPSSNAAVLTFAGSKYTANAASQFVIAGQTLTPGGTITASGTPISLPQGTAFAVIGTSTQSLGPAQAPIMTWAGHTYTADASSDFIIAAQTLSPGGAITVQGTPIRLAPGATAVVVGGVTELLAPEDLVTVAGQLVTAAPTGFVLDGSTVLPGGSAVVVQGTTVSLGLGGSLVVGGSTTVLPGGSGSATGVVAFEGGQGRVRVGLWLCVGLWVVLGGVLLA